MSDQQPPSGTPEYLEPGGGQPLLTDPGAAVAGPPVPRRRRRTPWVLAVVGVLLLGGGAAAWAAMSWFRQGAQPAEALPASTLAYLSVDLDPSGSQKIDAFKTLDKFPAFKDQVGVDSTDDVRRKIGESILDGLHCQGMTYKDDVEPWLGDRAAVAAVDLGRAEPAPVVVVQVTDDDRARGALKALASCDEDASDGESFVVRDGWALLSGSQDDLDRIAAAADQGTLADDPTYQKWNDRVGDAGVVNMYAAPKAGVYLADRFGDWAGYLADPSKAFAASEPAPPPASAIDPDGELTKELRSFQGAAATIRFTGNGLELAVVSEADLPGASGFIGDRAGAGVTRLPDDTAAALGLSLQKGWLTSFLDRTSGAMGLGMSSSELTHQIEQSTGLRLPEDVETLLGDSTTVAVGGDFDVEGVTNATDGSQIPVGAVVQGDPTEVEAVLDKLRGSDAQLGQILGSDSSGGLVAVGPSADYRRELLAGGDLGSTQAFRDVVPSPEHASEILFVNMNRFERSVEEGMGSDRQTVDNVKPLEAIGFSAWLDGDLGRISLRVSTD